MKLARAAWLVLGAAAAGACDLQTVTAVGGPAGVYQPGGGCALAEAGSACPPPGAAFPQLRFEAAGDVATFPLVTPATTSDARVTCARSYCGSGALSAHADLSWNEAIQDDEGRFARFEHTFDPPIDLLDRTVSFAVSRDGPGAPMHAQVGVISDYWHWVAWAPVPMTGWATISGVVSPANPLTMLDAGATSVPVRSIRIDLYVPQTDAADVMESWSGTFYLDEIGWQ